MAKVTERHRTLANEVYLMGDLHGRAELYKSIDQAIADAEERGPQTEETKDDAECNHAPT